MVIGNDLIIGKRIFVCLVFGIMFFSLVGFVEMVDGLGASSYHWSGNPVNISQGEEKIISVSLQNRVEEGDMNVKGEVVSGGEVVRLVEDEYFLEAGMDGVQVNLSIKIPEDFESGKYEMIVKFVPVGVAGEGMVSVSVGTSKRIPIIIGGSLVEREFVVEGILESHDSKDLNLDDEVVQDLFEVDDGKDRGSLFWTIVFILLILILLVIGGIVVFYLLNRKKESEKALEYY